MHYLEAKASVNRRRIIGLGILLVAVVFTVVGALKGLYVSLDGGGAALAQLSLLMKGFVRKAYEITKWIPFVWQYAPTLDLHRLAKLGNVGFMFCYIMCFVGAAIIGSGNKLARRLRNIEVRIEDERIAESVRGVRVRTNEEVRQNIQVPAPSVMKEVHTLYVAPLVVAFLCWLVSKLFQ